MKTVFIIGGMGSGKSTVTRLFGSYGASILNLDVVGHDVLAIPDVKQALIETFGVGIVADSGEVDRKALASYAFASPEAAADLTRITEPRIAERLRAWLERQRADGCAVAVVEVSAFNAADGCYADIADSIVAVVAPVEARVQRAVRKGFDSDDVLRRISCQPTDSERRQWADYVIENDGSLDDVCSQAGSLWTKLTE